MYQQQAKELYYYIEKLLLISRYLQPIIHDYTRKGQNSLPSNSWPFLYTVVVFEYVSVGVVDTLCAWFATVVGDI